MSRRKSNPAPQVDPAAVDTTPRAVPVDVVEDAVTEPVVAEVAETPQRTAVKCVVFRQAPIPTAGQFLTKTVLGDQTVTLEVDVPKELPADVADALIALESKHFTIEPA